MLSKLTSNCALTVWTPTNDEVKSPKTRTVSRMIPFLIHYTLQSITVNKWLLVLLKEQNVPKLEHFIVGLISVSF